jgi:hypothetical protein
MRYVVSYRGQNIGYCVSYLDGFSGQISRCNSVGRESDYGLKYQAIGVRSPIDTNGYFL